MGKDLSAVGLIVCNGNGLLHCTVHFSPQNLVENKSVLGTQELLTNAYGLIAVSLESLALDPTGLFPGKTCSSNVYKCLMVHYIGSFGKY